MVGTHGTEATETERVLPEAATTRFGATSTTVADARYAIAMPPVGASVVPSLTTSSSTVVPALPALATNTDAGGNTHTTAPTPAHTAATVTATVPSVMFVSLQPTGAVADDDRRQCHTTVGGRDDTSTVTALPPETSTNRGNTERTTGATW